MGVLAGPLAAAGPGPVGGASRRGEGGAHGLGVASCVRIASQGLGQEGIDRLITFQCPPTCPLEGGESGR